MTRDHFIPQVYLKNFYSQKLGSLMYAFRKSDLKEFHTNAPSVCRIDDGSTNDHFKDERVLERFLNIIEPKYNAALEAVTGDSAHPRLIFALAGLVAYVQCCSPTGVRLNSNLMAAQVEETASLLERKGRLPQALAGLGGKSLDQLIEAGTVKVKVKEKYIHALGIVNLMRLAKFYGNSEWEILINDFAESPYFTSDFPVAIEMTDKPSIRNRIVPLSPRVALRIKPNIGYNRTLGESSYAMLSRRVRKVGHDEVRTINQQIVRCAENLVFSSVQLPWMKQFLRNNAGFRLEPYPSKLRRGDQTLHAFGYEVRAVRSGGVG